MSSSSRRAALKRAALRVVTPPVNPLALAVVGGQIVRASDNSPVILRGANFMSHEHRGTTSVIAAGLAKMRSEWGGNIGVYGVSTRGIMNNLAHPYYPNTPYLMLLDEIVAAGKANGCYTVFSARWSGIEGRAVGHDADQSSGPQDQFVGIPPQEAVDALAKLALRYKAEPTVLLAAQVETNGSVTWAQARTYYQAVLDAVRATGNTNIVMSSGLDFGRTINGATTAPVTGSNFVYKTHVYELQTSWSQFFTAAVDAGLPVFVGEFGQPLDYGGYAVMTQTEVDAILAYTSSHGMGWAAWAFEADQSPRLVTDEAAFTPNGDFGLSVRNEMQKTPATPGAAELAVAPTPRSLAGTANSATSVTWTWSAVTGVVRYEYRIGAGSVVSTGTTASATVTVASGSTTSLQVRSVTAAGTSSWSPAVSVATSGGVNISRNRPITASSGSGVGVLVDGQWDFDLWRSSGYPATVTLDLSGVPTGQLGPCSLGWTSDNYTADNVVTGGETYNAIGAYAIQAATSSAGPWTTLVTVGNNTRRARTHRIDLTGYTWLRLNLTGGQSTNNSGNVDASIAKLEVISGAAPDSWLIFGDSITTAGAQVHNGLGSKVETLDPARRPLFEPLGIPGVKAVDLAPGGGAVYRGQWLQYLDDTACHYVTLNLGTNDVSGVPAASYETAMRALIADVTSRGKVPVIPTIPWSRIQDSQPFNARLATIYADTPSVLRGPDLYAFYAANQSLISTDGIHPTTAGYVAWADQWAQALVGTSSLTTEDGQPITDESGSPLALA